MDNMPPNQDRTKRQLEIATSITGEVAGMVADGIPADAALADVFRDHPGFGARDRRLYGHAVFSFFRWRGWVERLEPGDLHRQCAWAVVLDPATEPESAAAWVRAAGLDPAMVDGWRRAGHDNRLDELMPEWLARVMPEDAARHDFIRACFTRPPTWLAIPADEVAAFTQRLNRLEWEDRVDPRIPGAVAIFSRFHLATLEKAWGQAIQVQDIASQAVVVVCEAQAGEQWWDACAGSGGKALGIARAVSATGGVLASDTRASILKNLTERARRHRIEHIQTQVLDAANRRPDRLFDGVLVDAPCSGIGTWPRNPDARWRTRLDDIRKNADRQRAILDCASGSVKPGGRLVYSVCTMTRAESEDVVHEFLEQHRDFQLVPFRHPLTAERAPGMTMINPADGPGDGMFIARMQRTG